MRLFSALGALALCTLHTVAAKSVWSFEDAKVTMQSRSEDKAGVRVVEEKFDPKKPVPSPVTIPGTNQIRVSLTITENGKPKKPHQAFLTLTEPSTGLEESFPLRVQESGKAGVSVAQKDVPVQLLASPKPLRAFLTIGSFGSSTPLQSHVFDLSTPQDSTKPLQAPPPPLRYGKLPEIHHIFKSDPKSPPVFITAVFGCMVFVTLPVLLGVWMELGLNVSHLPEAFASAPIAHGLFYGSIFLLEIIFGLYYLRLTLFQALPAVGVVGTLCFLSGSRALGEVQGRRLAGKR